MLAPPTANRFCLQLAAALVVGLGLKAWAENPQLEIRANRDTMYLGETLVLTIKTRGVDSPQAAPNLSAITNAAIRSLGSQSDSRFSITIINGRVNRESSSGRIYTYEIKPHKTGRFVAGPITLTLGSLTLSHPGPAVAVTGIDTQDVVVLDIKPSRDAVLIDEPFDVAVTVAIKRLKAPFADIDPLDPSDPPWLDIPFLDEDPIDGLEGPNIRALIESKLVQANNKPGFTLNNYQLQPNVFDMGFGGSGAKRARFLFDRQTVTQNGQPCFTYGVTLRYTPRKEGSYTFGPAVFKGKAIIDADEQGRAIGKTIFAVGPACTVRVVPPPDEGRPPSYIGALGSNLVVDASLDTQTCNVGDPLKLTLSISGSTRLDAIYPPSLSGQPGVTNHFRIIEDTMEALTRNGARQYTYTVRPTHAGTFEFPPIDVSYYDTTERRYKTAQTRPIPLQVRQSTTVQAAHIIFTATNAPDPGSRRDSIDPTVMAPLSVDPQGARPARLGLHRRHWILAIAGPTLCLIALAGRLIVRHSPQLARARRRRQAASAALARLRQAARNGTPAAEAHRQVADALRQYLGERLDVPSAGLTPAETRDLVFEATGSAELASRFSRTLENSFNAAFAAAGAAETPAIDTQEATETLRQIEEALRLKARGANS